MGGSAAVLAAVILLGGAVVDALLIEPFFLSTVAGTSFAGWDPLTIFLFLYGVPYAASCAIASAVVAAISGAF